MWNLMVHLFLPHHTNNHRPKVLHVNALGFYALILAIFYVLIPLLHREFPSVLGYATSIYVEEVLKDTNQQRSASGLVPLRLNEQLSRAAAAKAQDMFAKGYWAHNSPDGKKPWDFIMNAGYRYSLAGENLAKNFSTSQNVVDAWMASPTHKENILKAGYRDVGLAVVNGVLAGEETTLVVQMFGTLPSGIAALPQKPVVVPEAVPEVVPELLLKQPALGASNIFTAVTKKPLIDLPSLTRDVILMFVGILMGVLVVDAWAIAKRGTVRVTGHNIAHLMFFAVVLFIVGFAIQGRVL